MKRYEEGAVTKAGGITEVKEEKFSTGTKIMIGVFAVVFTFTILRLITTG